MGSVTAITAKHRTTAQTRLLSVTFISFHLTAPQASIRLLLHYRTGVRTTVTGDRCAGVPESSVLGQSEAIPGSCEKDQPAHWIGV